MGAGDEAVAAALARGEDPNGGQNLEALPDAAAFDDTSAYRLTRV